MRNMMLQVRNWSKISILPFILFIALAVLAGCKNNDEPDNPYVAPDTTEDPLWAITVDSTDLTTSMTAIVRLTFTQSRGTLAAFMGNECCDIAEWKDSLYWLYISPAAVGSDVQLRFYSPKAKRIFVANETFPFVNNGHLGSISEPYTPTWR